MKPHLRFRMRVNLGETIAIGPGKIALLEAIRSEGSISAAARHLGMSYRRAWVLLDEINRSLKTPAAMSGHGGVNGGGSMLTATGEELVALYRSIEEKAEAAASPEIAALLRLLG